MSVRVLSISQLYPGSSTPGQGIFIHRRLQGLPDAHRVRVWRVRPWFPLLRSSSVPSREEVDGTPVEDVPFLYLPGMFKGMDGSMLLRALRRRPTDGIDVLDAHFAYPTGWAAVRLGKERGLPTVVTLRGTEEPYSKDPARRRRIEETVRDADRVIAVSSSLARLAVECGADPDRVRVVGNGVDPIRFVPADDGQRRAARARLGLPADASVLLTVGGLAERKGVGRVIDLLPRLASSRPSLIYLVAGGGGPEGDERAALERRAQDLGVEDRVWFLGQLPPDELPQVYQASDAFVLATRNEGWANALHEAIACGLPSVATDVGGNREVLGDGAAGILVPFGDADALREAIEGVFDGALDPGTVAAIGRSRTWSIVGEETAQVFRAARGMGS